MENYIGKKFGRLIVKDIIIIKQKGRNRKFFKCICDCGKEHITRADGVLGGKTFSCGCQKNDHNKGKNYKHFSYGTRLYNIWAGMKQRCENKRCHCYKYYGERGIDICNEWKNDFLKFKEWADKTGYNENLTIDRIDVNKNYCPENCRWSTAKEQCRNKTNNHFETYLGKTMCLTEWAENIGMNIGTLISGIRKGRKLEYYINKYGKGLI